MDLPYRVLSLAAPCADGPGEEIVVGHGGRSFNFRQNFSAETENLTHDFPLTEPLIMNSLHIDGFTAHTLAGIVHFAGWQTIRPLSEGIPGERRVVVRFAMSEYEASSFRCAIGWALGVGH